MEAMGPAENGLPARRREWILLAALAAVSAGCWAFSLGMAGHAQHRAGLFALSAMWIAMMLGMMLLPELPFATTLLRARVGQRPLLDAAAFLSGFLTPWIAFSAGAALLQSQLQSMGLMDHGMALTSPRLAGALLLLAGAVQLSPLKRACLQRCRRPALGDAGAPLPGGLRYGALSVASCGLLMLVLFVTGVMSLPGMALLTALLLLEKVLPRDRALRLGVGLMLVAWGAWKIAS